MQDSTPEHRAALSAGLELKSRLDVAEHRIARAREAVRELRADPTANVWRCIGRLEVILDVNGEDTETTTD